MQMGQRPSLISYEVPDCVLQYWQEAENHHRVDFQLFEAAIKKGPILTAQLDEVRWMEGQPLVKLPCKLPSKSQLGSNLCF